MTLIIDVWEGNLISGWNDADGYIFCASWTMGIEDKQFGYGWVNCPKPRGAYFAQYFDVSSADQAKKFFAILSKYGGVRSGDRIFTDVEVGQLSLTGIIDFWDYDFRCH